MPEYIIRLVLKGTKLEVDSCFLPKRRLCAAHECRKSFIADQEVYQIYCNDCLENVVKCASCGLEDVSSTLVEAMNKKKVSSKICVSCANRHYIKCFDCKKYFDNTLVKTRGGQNLCFKCEMNWKACGNCKNWDKASKFSSYKDEFVSYENVCSKCKDQARTNIPQNVPIEESTDDIEERIKTKKNPVLKLAGVFLYKQGDYNLKQIVELLEKLGMKPIKDIYFYGLKTEDFTVCSNKQFSKTQKNFAEENSIGLRVNEGSKKDRLAIGLSTDLRETAKKCSEFLSIFLNDDMRKVVKSK